MDTSQTCVAQKRTACSVVRNPALVDESLLRRLWRASWAVSLFDGGPVAGEANLAVAGLQGDWRPVSWWIEEKRSLDKVAGQV